MNLRYAFAPFFSAGFFRAQRRRIVKSWVIVAVAVGVKVLGDRTPSPVHQVPLPPFLGSHSVEKVFLESFSPP